MGSSSLESIRKVVGGRVTIYPRGKKRTYWADFHFQGHRKRSLKTSRLSEAEKMAALIAADLLRGDYQLKSKAKRQKRIAMKQTMEDFTEFHRAEGTRPKTISKYNGILTRFREFCGPLGIEYLSQVKLDVIDKFRAERKQTLSPKSMHHEGSLLKMFFNWCVERGYIEKNPLATRKFSRPKAKRSQMVLTLKQVDAILAAASLHWRPILAFLAFAGTRSGECRNLLVIDVDFKSNWIQIRSRDGFPTKEGNEWKVPIHPRLRPILEAAAETDSGWFFKALPSTKYPEGNHHINTKHLNEGFLKILTRLEIPAGARKASQSIRCVTSSRLFASATARPRSSWMNGKVTRLARMRQTDTTI